MVKRKNKIGVSLMVSYVLLISITIVLSLGVYIWLKNYANVEEKINCKDGTSLIIEDYKIEQVGLNKTLNLSIKNNGFFNISGFSITVGNNSERVPTKQVMVIDQLNLLGYFDFKPKLAPGKNQYALFNLEDLDKLETIQIQPFVYNKDKTNRIFCEQELKKQVISINPSSITNLVSWWRFDGNVLDYSSGNDGIIYGNPVYVDGKVGKALDFDGDGDYVEIPDDGLSLDINDELTIESWVNYSKQSETGDHDVVWSGEKWVYSLRRSGDLYKFIIYDNQTNWKSVDTTGITFHKDVWYHIVGTYKNGESIKIYVDGVLNSETSIGAITLNEQIGYIRLGVAQGTGLTGEWFNGIIDDVAIYDKALTEWEIAQLYNSYNLG